MTNALTAGAPTLVQYDDTIVKVDPGLATDNADGQPFNCPGAKNRWFAFGHAPYGGRREHGGPIFDEPRAFVYGCAGVIDNGPGNPMQGHLDLTLNVGDVVFVKGYGFHRLDLHWDRYNLNLTPCTRAGEDR